MYARGLDTEAWAGCKIHSVIRARCSHSLFREWTLDHHCRVRSGCRPQAPPPPTCVLFCTRNVRHACTPSQHPRSTAVHLYWFAVAGITNQHPPLLVGPWRSAVRREGGEREREKGALKSWPPLIGCRFLPPPVFFVSGCQLRSSAGGCAPGGGGGRGRRRRGRSRTPPICHRGSRCVFCVWYLFFLLSSPPHITIALCCKPSTGARVVTKRRTLDGRRWELHKQKYRTYLYVRALRC